MSWNKTRTVNNLIAEKVTLHVSVWVEIKNARIIFNTISSRSTWACELKLNRSWPIRNWNSSRSTWACELKFDKSDSFINDTSHAPRERVSWNFLSWNNFLSDYSHAPRERVSWNLKWKTLRKRKQVTLHVSVWVEMLRMSANSSMWSSRSTWACELKFNVRWNYMIVSMSRSTWACELKFFKQCMLFCTVSSRSTWACELKLPFFNALEIVTSHAPRERVSWNDSLLP